MTFAASAKHRFYVPPTRVGGEQVRFDERQAHQLSVVLRLRAGDCVRVFDGDGRRELLVQLDQVSKSAASGRVLETAQAAREPATRLVVYPALLQREKLEHVFQKLVEVGASEIVPVLTVRSLVRDQPPAERYHRWESIVREAAEQSGRCALPVVGRAVPLETALERAVMEGPTLFAYEATAGAPPLRETLGTLVPAGGQTISLFVGPEGGYAPEEVAAARRAGATVVSLGPRILRTETASPILAAIVLYALGEMD